MSSFYSCKLFKFKYVIFLLTFALLIISQKIISSSFFFFDLCYETGGPYVGKSHLLNRYVNNSSHDTEAFREGKKTFNNEHKNDPMIF